MQLGLSSYAYGWAVAQGLAHFDEHTLLDRTRQFGLRLSQFGDHIPLVQFDARRLDRLRARSVDQGIALEVGARGLWPENLLAHISLCERLGSRLLRFVVDSADFEPSPAQIVGILRAHASRLEASGVTLGIENHDRLGVRVLKQIVQEVGSPSVGICLDTANSLGAGEGLGEVLQVLGEHTVNLHLKDFAIARVPSLMGFMVQGRAAGEGMMDAPRVVAQVERWGRCATAVVETWTPPEADIEATLAREREWARRSVEFLQSLKIWSEPSP